MLDAARHYSLLGSCWSSAGGVTAFRNSSVYQISKYPSREKKTVKAFRLQPDGANSSKALGNEILQPGPGGAIVVGASRATIAARRGSSARVDSHWVVGWPP